MRGAQTKPINPAIKFNNLRRRRNRLLNQWSQLPADSLYQKAAENKYYRLVERIEAVCLDTMVKVARLDDKKCEPDAFEFAIQSARRDEAVLMLTLSAQTELYPKLRQRYDELSDAIEGPAVSALLSLNSRE